LEDEGFFILAKAIWKPFDDFLMELVSIKFTSSLQVARKVVIAWDYVKLIKDY
jgi:hypothetical protein